MHSDMLHHSVLLQEVVEALGPTDGHFYLDATFGNGGYSRALLERADCCVVAIDRDPTRSGAALPCSRNLPAALCWSRAVFQIWPA
jgi:16S rRNA (cytosine1402-N4)-methyltransferase